jgi:hypothetical protein
MENGKWRMERQHLAGSGPEWMPVCFFYDIRVNSMLSHYSGET